MKTKAELLVYAGAADIFLCNSKTYQIACASYLEEIAARPFEEEELIEELKRVIKRHQEVDLSIIPPHLCRKPGESMRDFNERTFSAWP